MEIARVGATIALVALCGAAHAQHSLTYSQVSVAPGTVVTINGEQYVAVQVGVREFTQDKRYAVRFLTPLGQDNAIFAILQTTHTNDPLDNPNATIDTFPAHVQVTDGRNYAITTQTDFNTFELSNWLQVEASATAYVQVKLGDALLSFFAQVTRTDQEVDLGQGEVRGTSQSTYGKYTDPTNIISSPGLDKWIDYIRIIPLN